MADQPDFRPCFVRVTVASLPVIIRALIQADMQDLALNVVDFTRDYTDPEQNAEREAWLAKALSTVRKEGEIEFDSDATISHSEGGGQYVLGWVWVRDDS